MCIHGCGIRAHVVNGVVVKIEGNPDDPDNLGKLCAKGNAGIMKLYDPTRFKGPLIRTSKKRGPTVDPEWKQVSWKEAFGVVEERFRALRKQDPRKLVTAIADFQRMWAWGWPMSFGTMNYFTAHGTYCGSAYHPVNAMTDGSFATFPDLNYCNYLIMVGASDGYEAHLHLSGSAKRMADARRRGMELVVVDPRLSVAAAKADLWVPIRPATDGAFALGMMYVLLFELNRFDVDYIKRYTNGPCLVGRDGLFFRDPSSKKPFVWDPVDQRPKVYDDPSIKGYALEGEYDGYRPAFQYLKDEIKQWTPEKVSEITTIPARLIRSLSKRYVEEAKIGSTIEIGGKTYPLRPACLQYYRGAQSHKHGVLDNMSLKLVNTLIGNIDAPGGHLGVSVFGNLAIWPGEDGMHHAMPINPIEKWSFEPRFPPDTTNLIELTPVGQGHFGGGHLSAHTVLEPQKYWLNYEPDSLFILHCNAPYNMPETKTVMQAMDKFKFVVAVDVYPSESSDWADVILPDHTYLESWSICESEAPFVIGPGLRQPVVPPLYDTRDATDILSELAERLEFLDRWNDVLNHFFELYKKPEYLLDPYKRHSIEEILDHYFKANFGEEWSLEKVAEKGHMVRLRTPEELYMPYNNMRIPVYYEFMQKVKYKMDDFISDHKLPLDISDYLPVPTWKPSPIHNDADHDLYAVNYKSALHAFSDSTVNPWLQEVMMRHSEVPYVLINSETAKSHSIRDLQRVKISSKFGEATAVAKITEGVHPEVIAMTNMGHWCRHIFGPKAGGVNYNRFLSAGLDYTDLASGVFETVAKVKVESA
ncbi:MAG: molybdopterin-dependent oxidoreductase [Nitrososphaerota archaeon]|nr:molybdopterin-dependent oxidoreductase [Nitrososphaerota archaeon]